MYEAVPDAVVDGFFSEELAPLAEVHHKALALLRSSADRQSALSVQLAQATGTTDDDKSAKDMLARRIARIQAASDRLQQVAQAYDTLLDSLVANKDNLDVLVRQYAASIGQGKEKRFALIAKVHRMGGSHYTEKNVRTLFGAMPFHVMGGVVVSCSLFDVASGNLLASRTIPVHSGFHPVKNLATFISPS